MPIERKAEARFLGVIIDDSLSWSRHVKTVISKMSKYVGIMYKIKKLLPLNVRLQVYHSFIQSHINYCSLVWGFCCKSNIEAIFSKQKKGLRAVIPGFINYKFRVKDGSLPGHTKPYFSEYKILTVHSIIALNAFLLIHKIRNFPSLIPLSIRSTFSEDSPVSGSTQETCEEWLKTYNTHIYRKSVFFKGPMLNATSSITTTFIPDSFFTAKALRANLKRSILDLQSSGDINEWQNENFILSHITGLRKSCSIKLKGTVSYVSYF